MVEYYTFPPLDAPHTLTAEMQETYTVRIGYSGLNRNYGANRIYYRRNSTDAWTLISDGRYEDVVQDVGKDIYVKQEMVNSGMISTGTTITETDQTETVEMQSEFTVDFTVAQVMLNMPKHRYNFTWDSAEITKVEIYLDESVWTEIDPTTKTFDLTIHEDFKLRATLAQGVTFNSFKISVDGVLKQTLTENPTRTIHVDDLGVVTVDVDASVTSYEITVEQPAHGTIVPGTGMHEAGSTPRFTITPDEGYRIVNILVDGVPVQPDYNYGE